MEIEEPNQTTPAPEEQEMPTGEEIESPAVEEGNMEQQADESIQPVTAMDQDILNPEPLIEATTAPEPLCTVTSAVESPLEEKPLVSDVTEEETKVEEPGTNEMEQIITEEPSQIPAMPKESGNFNLGVPGLCFSSNNVKTASDGTKMVQIHQSQITPEQLVALQSNPNIKVVFRHIPSGRSFTKPPKHLLLPGQRSPPKKRKAPFSSGITGTHIEGDDVYTFDEGEDYGVPTKIQRITENRAKYTGSYGLFKKKGRPRLIPDAGSFNSSYYNANKQQSKPAKVILTDLLGRINNPNAKHEVKLHTSQINAEVLANMDLNPKFRIMLTSRREPLPEPQKEEDDITENPSTSALVSEEIKEDTKEEEDVKEEAKSTTQEVEVKQVDPEEEKRLAEEREKERIERETARIRRMHEEEELERNALQTQTSRSGRIRKPSRFSLDIARLTKRKSTGPGGESSADESGGDTIQRAKTPGRPPLAKIVHEVKSEPSPAAGETPVRRKRGRPRKSLVQPVQQLAKESQENKESEKEDSEGKKESGKEVSEENKEPEKEDSEENKEPEKEDSEEKKEPEKEDSEEKKESEDKKESEKVDCEEQREPERQDSEEKGDSKEESGSEPRVESESKEKTDAEQDASEKEEKMDESQEKEAEAKETIQQKSVEEPTESEKEVTSTENEPKTHKAEEGKSEQVESVEKMDTSGKEASDVVMAEPDTSTDATKPAADENITPGGEGTTEKASVSDKDMPDVSELFSLKVTDEEEEKEVIDNKYRLRKLLEQCSADEIKSVFLPEAFNAINFGDLMLYKAGQMHGTPGKVNFPSLYKQFEDLHKSIAKEASRYNTMVQRANKVGGDKRLEKVVLMPVYHRPAAECLDINSMSIDAHICGTQRSMTTQIIAANSFFIRAKMEPPTVRLNLPEPTTRSLTATKHRSKSRKPLYMNHQRFMTQQQAEPDSTTPDQPRTYNKSNFGGHHIGSMKYTSLPPSKQRWSGSGSKSSYQIRKPTYIEQMRNGTGVVPLNGQNHYIAIPSNDNNNTILQTLPVDSSTNVIKSGIDAIQMTTSTSALAQLQATMDHHQQSIVSTTNNIAEATTELTIASEKTAVTTNSDTVVHAEQYFVTEGGEGTPLTEGVTEGTEGEGRKHLVPIGDGQYVELPEGYSLIQTDEGYIIGQPGSTFTQGEDGNVYVTNSDGTTAEITQQDVADGTAGVNLLDTIAPN